MAVIQSCRLVCTTQGHNKEYVVELDEEFDQQARSYRYRVDGRYGRIGSVLTGVRKYNGLSRGAAETEYEKVRNEKINKGYTEAPLRNSFLADPAPEPAPARRRTARTPAPTLPPPADDLWGDTPRLITI
jgi:predicted DNA-binding WGR domain protein